MRVKVRSVLTNPVVQKLTGTFAATHASEQRLLSKYDRY